MKKIITVFATGMMIFLFSFCLQPTQGFAAEQGGENPNISETKPNDKIFDTIQSKMVSTLKDLRKIVYVIAGFGLVMFAVLAIFNKISYKHLGYIMIGLSLLSLMFPFLEYFSGYSLETEMERKQTFDNFLNAKGEVASATGNDLEKGQEGEKDPNAPADIDLPEYDETVPDEEVEEDDLPYRVYLPEVNAKLEAAGCQANSPSSKSSWDANGQRNVCTVDGNGNVSIQTETCQGKVNKTGVCKKTALQTLRDVADMASKARTAVSGAVNAAMSVGQATIAATSGIRNMYNAAANGNWDNLQNISGSLMSIVGAGANALNNTTSAVSAGMGGALAAGDSLAGIATTASQNYETNPYGNNSFSDSWREGKFREGIVDANSSVNSVNNAGQDAVRSVNTTIGQTGNTIGVVTGAGERAQSMGDAFGDIFNKDTWGKHN